MAAVPPMADMTNRPLTYLSAHKKSRDGIAASRTNRVTSCEIKCYTITFHQSTRRQHTSLPATHPFAALCLIGAAGASSYVLSMTDRAGHTTYSRPIEVPPKLPNTALPDADWADAFEVVSKRRFASMRELARESVGSMPVWARRLLDLRNIIVRPFGLKPDGINDAPDHGARVDIFPIISEAKDEMVLGLNDKHVDFRIVLERAPVAGGTRIRVTTLVQRHNLFGRLYIVAITPFHKAIAAASLRQLA